MSVIIRKGVPFGFLLFLYLPLSARAQDHQTYPSNLHIVYDTGIYQRQCREDRNAKLEDLRSVIPGIALDIRYADSSNFMHKPVYAQSGAFLRHAAAIELKKVEDALRKEGLGLLVYDAYRPYSVTVKIFSLVRNTDFAASPMSGSRHNRGCAIDVSLIDIRTGKSLSMPSSFDAFTEKAHSDYMQLPDSILRHRALLKGIMEAHGFSQLKTEWWHFDFRDWKSFDLLDIPFSAL